MGDDILGYLIEYKKLCEKYDLIVSSCGCCDSPWVIRTYPEYENVEEYINDLMKKGLR